MGNALFDTDIAGIIADAIGEAVFDVTIRREVRGGRVAGNLTAGRAVSYEEVACKGFWDDINPGSVPPGIALEQTDRKLVLIGDTIPVGGHPRRNDACTVHEPIGDVTLYCVQPLSRDPAAAVYAYLCRDRGGVATSSSPPAGDPTWQGEEW